MQSNAGKMDMSKLLFSFDGRIGRATFWLATIGATVVSWLVILLLVGTTGGNSDGAFALMILLYIPLCWVGLALSIKRWHDRDKSGWWVLIGLVPIIGGIWAFVETGCLQGTIGPNQYGEDPLQSVAQSSSSEIPEQ